MKRIIGDKNFHNGLSEAYKSELKLKPRIPIALDFKRIAILIGGTVISYNSIVIDGMNYLPNFISALFAIGAIISLLKYVRKAWILIIPDLIGGVVAAFNLVSQIRYSLISGYVPEDSLWLSNAGKLYSPIKLYSAIESACMLIVILGLLGLLFVCWKKENAVTDLHRKPDVFVLEERKSIKIRFATVVVSLCLIGMIWTFYPTLVLFFNFVSSIAILLTVVWTFFSSFLIADISNTYKKLMSM